MTSYARIAQNSNNNTVTQYSVHVQQQQEREREREREREQILNGNNIRISLHSAAMPCMYGILLRIRQIVREYPTLKVSLCYYTRRYSL